MLLLLNTKPLLKPSVIITSYIAQRPDKIIPKVVHNYNLHCMDLKTYKSKRCS